MKKRIGIQGFLMFIAVILAIIFSKFLFAPWAKESNDELFDAVGIIILLFGFLFRMAARGYKSEKSDEGKSLIKDGPYGIIRNPMFFGTFLIGAGIVMIIFKWWVILVFIFLFLAIYIPQVKKESNYLLGRFGDQYRRYCREVPLFFPNIVYLLRRERKKLLFFKWQWVKREWLSLVLVLGIVLSIETWQDIQLFGAAELVKELLESAATIFVGGIVITLLFYEK